MQLIFDVWREVCRHLEIHESVDRLLPRLGESLPLDALVIRRIDRPRSCLETVASGLARASTRVPAGKTSLREAELATLLKWCKRGDVAQRVKSSAAAGAEKRRPPAVRPNCRLRAWTGWPRNYRYSSARSPTSGRRRSDS